MFDLRMHSIKNMIHCIENALHRPTNKVSGHFDAAAKKGCPRIELKLTPHVLAASKQGVHLSCHIDAAA